MRLDNNMILGQLKMGENQAKYGLWSLGGFQQPFSCVGGHLSHGDERQKHLRDSSASLFWTTEKGVVIECLNWEYQINGQKAIQIEVDPRSQVWFKAARSGQHRWMRSIFISFEDMKDEKFVLKSL